MREYTPFDTPLIHILGRTARRAPLTLFWTASGIEVFSTGSELYIDLSADYGIFEPWVELTIDGQLTQRRMLDKGRQRICAYRAMEPGRVRRVRLMRATQAANNDPQSLLQVHAVLTDGELVPPTDSAPRRRIEVVGDSITSGEGLGGSLLETTWNASLFAAYGSYTYLLGEALNADVNVISQSGYGVYCSWRGEPRESIPRYYGRICGPVTGERNTALGAQEPWDFDGWRPDAVVVNLGTNDSGSFDQGGVYFPDVDWTCPMRLEPDGSMHAEDRQRILDAVVDFLRALRRHNPTSYILWCYGMLGDRLDATLREAISLYSRESGDRNVDYLSLPNTAEGELGARWHPGYVAHRRAAEIIAGRLREVSGE